MLCNMRQNNGTISTDVLQNIYEEFYNRIFNCQQVEKKMG